MVKKRRRADALLSSYNHHAQLCEYFLHHSITPKYAKVLAHSVQDEFDRMAEIMNNS